MWPLLKVIVGGGEDTAKHREGEWGWGGERRLGRLTGGEGLRGHAAAAYAGERLLFFFWLKMG